MTDMERLSFGFYLYVFSLSREPNYSFIHAGSGPPVIQLNY
jgi:hypothetical protein